MYFIALYEKCDTTGQMKDIATHAVKMVEFCALQHDHRYCSFTTRVCGKIVNQILLEMLLNCTKHFDSSSSLTASCVARCMIC